ANSAIFSAVNAELIRPFPFKRLSRIMAVWETAPKEHVQHAAVAPANFLDWIKQNKSFDLLAADHDWNANLTGRGLAERVEGYQVTANFFPWLAQTLFVGSAISRRDWCAEVSGQLRSVFS
ncbi:MAG: hypothetical protein M1423_03105, partial [Acidobacteria bacterium]|nr:hypothetical protein [Acidobacteriota bacterium]